MERDIEFLFEIGQMRHITRTWTQFNMHPVANLAEHSFRAMWTSMVLAKSEGCENTGEILRLLLVHDVGEIRTGDAHYLSSQYVKRDEERAVRDTFAGTSLSDQWIADWEKIEARAGAEGKVAKDADTLDVEFELQEQAALGNKVTNDWMDTRYYARDRMFTQAGKNLFKGIYASNLNDWHRNGPHKLKDEGQKEGGQADRDLEFLFEVGTLRNIERTWKYFGFSPANVAEHTYRLIWTALVIAAHEGCEDTDEIVKMALVHDLGELRCGDIHFGQKKYTERDEARAIRDTFFGTSIGEDWLPVWESYETHDSQAAQIVKDADFIDSMLEVEEMRAHGETFGDSARPVLDKRAKEFYTQTAKKLYTDIQGLDPYSWHLRNMGITK